MREAKENKDSAKSHARKLESKSKSGEGNQEKCQIACPQTRTGAREWRRKTRMVTNRMPTYVGQGDGDDKVEDIFNLDYSSKYD